MEVIKITRRKIENTQMQENFELSKSKLDTILCRISFQSTCICTSGVNTFNMKYDVC